MNMTVADKEGRKHTLTEDEGNFIRGILIEKHWQHKSYRVSYTFPLAGLIQPHINIASGPYCFPDVWVSGTLVAIAFLWLRNTYNDFAKRAICVIWGLIMVIIPFFATHYFFEHKLMLWGFGILFIIYGFGRKWMHDIILTHEEVEQLKKFRAGEITETP